MTEWKEYILSDVMDIIGGGTPKTSIPEYWSGTIPWLSVVDFGNENKFVQKTEKNITELGLKNSSTKILSDGQIIISARGTVGELAVIKGNMAFNQSCYGLSAKELICNNNYLYYLLKCKIVELKRKAHGAVFDTITRNTFDTITAIIPDLPTQSAIAEILSSLDDKIELNNKINQELESLAQLLFKRWFVDFEFPNEDGEPYKSSGGEMIESELGEIPKGWEVISLTDVMDFQGGTQPPSTQFTNILSSNSIRLIQIRDYYTSNHLTFIPKSSNYKCCEQKDIMIARYGASVGRILFGLEGAYNVALVKVIPMKKNYREFLRSYLNSPTFQDRLLSLSGRSAQAGFNKDDFSSFKIPFPKNGKILNIYEEIFNTSIDIFLNNKKEISTLEELRDFLLPKLISGELQINNN